MKYLITTVNNSSYEVDLGKRTLTKNKRGRTLERGAVNIVSQEQKGTIALQGNFPDLFDFNKTPPHVSLNGTEEELAYQVAYKQTGIKEIQFSSKIKSIEEITN